MPHAPTDDLRRLIGILQQAPGALVLTGAGMSTDSGIPDYRGPDGNRRVTPMQHGEFVGSSQARQRYWARSFVGWGRFAAAEPNVGHRAVAALQRAGALGEVITQNVDGLHQRAGSRKVVELHGSLAEVTCLACGTRVDRDLLQAQMTDENPGFAERAESESSAGSRVSFVRRASAQGIPVLIVTRGSTRGDDLATVRIDAELAPTLSALAVALGE